MTVTANGARFGVAVTAARAQQHATVTEHLCRCSHVHGEGRCWSRACGCTVLRSTKAGAA